MNPDLLMGGAMLAACLSVYALGRALLPKGVRVRIQPVRRSAAREAALCVSHFSDGRVAELEDARAPRRPVVSALDPSVADCVGSTPTPATNLVPFSRAEQGYAFSFAQKNKNAFSRNRPTVLRSKIEPTR